MKKISLFFSLLFYFNLAVAAAQTDLISVFQQALTNDPIYQQAVATRLAIHEDIPISRAALLPNVTISGGPAISKLNNTGAFAHGLDPTANTTRSYSANLSITQTIFDFAQFSTVSSTHAIAKKADATLNAAMEDLMLRVAKTYFTILQDEDNLAYISASKHAYAKQLNQVNQQFKVGMKTITDVYTAQASYDNSSAAYIAAEIQLTNDKENLRAITGSTYPSLAKLSEQFPFITPQPTNMESWVTTAEKQNWGIKAAQYAAEAAREQIKQQYAGHFPTLNAQGTYDVSYLRNLASSELSPSGTNKNRAATLSLNLNLPIFEGGLVTAETNQARYNYQAMLQQLEFSVRSTINATRQSYLGIISGIKQIQADKQAIKSAISSRNGLHDGYQVGTQTLVDVLNQQQNVFQAQKQYASDRYAYVNNLLILKNAAGTLSQQDLAAINAWLIHTDSQVSNPITAIHSSRSTSAHNKKNKHVQPSSVPT